MSDEEKQAEQPQYKWGDPVSPERKADLQGILDAWNAPDADQSERKGPFDTVWLVGADVSWLAEQSGRDVHGYLPNLHLEGAYLFGAQLEHADLSGAHLERANLSMAQLEHAILNEAHMDHATLNQAQLEHAMLRFAHLKGARFSDANLEHADLSSADLEGADLSLAHLEGAYLSGAYMNHATFRFARLEGAYLSGAQMEGAILSGAQMEGADLSGAQMEGADLREAHLKGANLSEAHLEGADLSEAHLTDAILTGIFLDPATGISTAVLTAPGSDIGPTLADVRWGGVNLTAIDWDRIRTLQDEQHAERARDQDAPKNRKTAPERVSEYKAAGRAYRLLFVALRSQGLTAPATRYHYRAEIMDRKALWHRRRYDRWLFSWLLGTFAGYGDEIWRLFATYGTVIAVFALAFWIGANHALVIPSFRNVIDSFVLSVTSFHGRGLQPKGLTANDTVTALSGLEAVFGLLIEGIFIAAFTRRVTGG